MSELVRITIAGLLCVFLAGTTSKLMDNSKLREQLEQVTKEKERAEKAYTQLLKRGELCQ